MTNTLAMILVVENNEDDYEAISRSLNANRISNPVHWCKSGQAALDYLYASNNPLPGLILLDLNMPGLDGRQVLEVLKDHADTQMIPVIILTTSNDPTDVERCYKIGASTFIQKPVDFSGLTNAFRTMKDYWFDVAILPGKKSKQ